MPISSQIGGIARPQAGAGNNAAKSGVLLSKVLNGPRERESWAVTSNETQRSTGRYDWDTLAVDALELARVMPPGPERNEALKLASLLRCAADARGLVVAKRGRPPK